jgi:hypothetical protein
LLKDRILAATIAGMIATMVKTVPNYFLWKFGVVKYFYLHIAASAMVLNRDIDSFTGLAVGFIVDIIMGGTLGIIIIMLLKYFGTDYWWYKGMVAGNIIWLWGLGVLINLGSARLAPVDPLFRLTSLIEHQIFGLVATYLIVRWYPKEKTGII